MTHVLFHPLAELFEAGQWFGGFRFRRIVGGLFGNLDFRFCNGSRSIDAEGASHRGLMEDGRAVFRNGYPTEDAVVFSHSGIRGDFDRKCQLGLPFVKRPGGRRRTVGSPSSSTVASPSKG